MFVWRRLWYIRLLLRNHTRNRRALRGGTSFWRVLVGCTTETDVHKLFSVRQSASVLRLSCNLELHLLILWDLPLYFQLHLNLGSIIETLILLCPASTTNSIIAASNSRCSRCCVQVEITTAASVRIWWRAWPVWPQLQHDQSVKNRTQAVGGWWSFGVVDHKKTSIRTQDWVLDCWSSQLLNELNQQKLLTMKLVDYSMYTKTFLWWFFFRGSK